MPRWNKGRQNMSEMNQAAAAPGGGLLGWYKELDTKER